MDKYEKLVVWLDGYLEGVGEHPSIAEIKTMKDRVKETLEEPKIGSNLDWGLKVNPLIGEARAVPCGINIKEAVTDHFPDKNMGMK